MSRIEKSRPAFDQQRLAEALTKASGEKIEPMHLPFNRFHFENGQKFITFSIKRAQWSCRLDDYTCTNKTENRDPDDEGYDETPKPENGDERAVKSPDGKWLAFVVNNNLAVRAVETDGATHPETDSQLKDKNEPVVLSMEGSAGTYYAVSTITWSPDSKHIAVYRIRPGYRRIVDYVESSPPNQLQLKLMDFFVRNLKGEFTPDWNRLPPVSGKDTSDDATAFCGCPMAKPLSGSNSNWGCPLELNHRRLQRCVG